MSVSTVETAYAMLVAEGYLEAKPRSGFRVCRLSALSRPAAPAPAAPRRCRRRRALIFSTGSVDTALFPFAAWRRLQRQVLAGDEAVLRAGCAQGDEALRRAIATHLAEFRGVRAEPRQVVVGAGSEYLAGLLAQLFSGRCVRSGGAGLHPHTARAGKLRRRSGFMPVDAHGMQPAPPLPPAARRWPM